LQAVATDKPPTAAEAATNNEELGTFTNWLFRVSVLLAVCAMKTFLCLPA
jgi:hypothetical protein